MFLQYCCTIAALWYRIGGPVMTRCLTILASLTLLGGCALTDEIAASLSGKPETVAQPDPPVYCYQTLGKAECYPTPLPPNEAGRLIGYYGSPPRALTGSGPARP
ncbi:MAG: hypothetical protein ACK4ZN_09860 [Oceanibaculum sp.]